MEMMKNSKVIHDSRLTLFKELVMKTGPTQSVLDCFMQEIESLRQQLAEARAERDAAFTMSSIEEIAFNAGAASRDAEIAELVEDKGRLDFLDGNSKFKMGWSVGQSPVGNLSISAVIQLGKEPTTIREAIDTALAKVRKP